MERSWKIWNFLFLYNRSSFDSRPNDIRSKTKRSRIYNVVNAVTCQSLFTLTFVIYIHRVRYFHFQQRVRHAYCVRVRERAYCIGGYAWTCLDQRCKKYLYIVRVTREHPTVRIRYSLFQNTYVNLNFSIFIENKKKKNGFGRCTPIQLRIPAHASHATKKGTRVLLHIFSIFLDHQINVQIDIWFFFVLIFENMCFRLHNNVVRSA